MMAYVQARAVGHPPELAAAGISMLISVMSNRPHEGFAVFDFNNTRSPSLVGTSSIRPLSEVSIFNAPSKANERVESRRHCKLLAESLMVPALTVPAVASSRHRRALGTISIPVATSAIRTHTSRLVTALVSCAIAGGERRIGSSRTRKS